MRTLVCLMVSLWWACPLVAEPAQTLRVVTWNLQWFPGGRMGAPKDEQTRHIETVREEIRKLNPVILLLQEVSSQAALEETLQPLGKEWKVAVVSRFMQGNFLSGQQLAIAAKIPADAAWSEPTVSVRLEVGVEGVGFARNFPRSNGRSLRSWSPFLFFTSTRPEQFSLFG